MNKNIDMKKIKFFFERLLRSAMVLIILPLIMAVVLIMLPFTIGEYVFFGSDHITKKSIKCVDKMK